MKKKQTAILYLENAVVETVGESKYGWRVRAHVSRETDEGVSTKWFTVWFRERPEVEVGWSLNCSGYLMVRAYIDGDGEPRFSVELSGGRVQSSSPPEADPWTGNENDEKGWQQ